MNEEPECPMCGDELTSVDQICDECHGCGACCTCRGHWDEYEDEDDGE